MRSERRAPWLEGGCALGWEVGTDQREVPELAAGEWALRGNQGEALEDVKQEKSMTVWGKLLESSRRADRTSAKGLLCSSDKR